jgi:hypothetical protein
MSKKKAEILEKSLQQAAQGKSIDEALAPLVETAQLVSALAEPPPTPPNRLIRGRRLFLTEASRLRVQQTAKPKAYVWRAGNMRMKLAGALIAALLVFGMVFGVGQAAAASLPGGPLYGLKLTAEQARLELTSDPEAKAELAVELAENRLDEIGRMMAAGKTVDGATAHQAQQQLTQAFQAMHQVNGEGQLQARERLTNMIQNRHRVMALEVNGVSEQQQEPVRTLLRSMERVRAELHNGEGVSGGQQTRQRLGEDPEYVPEPPHAADQPGLGPQAGQGGGELDAAGETDSGGQGQGSMGPTEGESPGQGQGGKPVENPFGPNPNASFGPGSETVDPPMGPYKEDDSSSDGPSYGPGPGEPQEGSGKSQEGSGKSQPGGKP